jgi:hypothetical protein
MLTQSFAATAICLLLGAIEAGANDHYLALNKDTVHWGYFSKLEKPIITIDSGDRITVEMATHHACDE